MLLEIAAHVDRHGVALAWESGGAGNGRSTAGPNGLGRMACLRDAIAI
jgi:hypothetical protein